MEKQEKLGWRTMRSYTVKNIYHILPLVSNKAVTIWSALALVY